jgi:DNA-binding MarR family transcriptional regulator
MGTERTSNLLGALGIALAEGQQEAMRAASGLSDVEVAALNVVGEGRRQGTGLSIGQVRAALDLTHPGAVRVVDRLAAGGLVTRGPGTDGRRVALLLTSVGETTFTAQRRARMEVLTRYADVLRAELAGSGIDVEALLEGLVAVVPRTVEEGDHLCRLCDEQACPQDRCPVTITVTS